MLVLRRFRVFKRHVMIRLVYIFFYVAQNMIIKNLLKHFILYYMFCCKAGVR